MIYLLCAQIAVLINLVINSLKVIMLVQTYVRIERFMLAIPTAASPVIYIKEAGKTQSLQEI